jgi:hypothetical protein
VAIVRNGRPQYLLAAAACIHPTRFSAIVNGRVTASASERQRIARALNIDESSIFGALAMA